MITNAFMWFQYCLQREIYDGQRVGDLSIDPDLVKQVLSRWTSGLRRGDVLVSFNWDLLSETALHRAGKWSLRDGYGFDTGIEGVRDRSTVCILKLHGSVNWAQRDGMDEQPSIEHTRDFFGLPGRDDQYSTAGARWGGGRELVLPTYLKEISANRLLLNLWSQAHAALAMADSVTVIGFSLNTADAQARQLLASALRENSRVTSIEIVSPGGYNVTWGDFCMVQAKEPRWVRKPFEDWILADWE